MKNKVITNKYDPSEVESRWQKVWEKEGVYRPDLDASASLSTKKPFYNLMMFPYPSAEGMHVGNMYAFTGADVYGRFQRMQGKDVFEPIGLDGFGIHSENYAIKVGNHPAKQAEISEKNFYRQLKSIGNGFDWTRTVETYKPEYYKWTQWLFIQLFKAGLAYRKKAPVNFCPSCKTVLADEQVLDARCERCNSVVEKRDLEQWFFAITKYANRLLTNIPKLDWSEKVKIAQKQWIGKSEGAMYKEKIKDLGVEIEAYDSIPQTFIAQSFTVIAPEHPLVSELVKGTKYEKDVLAFVEKIKEKKRKKVLDLDKDIEGIFTGRYVDNPFGKGDLPIWVASFVIMEYGTGIVNSSAHDERDFAFAKKYKIPLRPVMFPKDPVEAEKVRNLEYCYNHAEDGILEEPIAFKGRKWGEVREDIIDYIVKKGFGRKAAQYHLRDWLISRQRYWGPPIPMIYCEKCSWEPVPEKDLPVKLPFIEDYKPLGTGQAPLASHPEFYKTKCPNCEGDARRETDVSDTFLDSSWYFLRYIATEFDDVPFNETRVKKWLPVNMYIGGAEHSVLHLLYSRFITMALKDLGFISFEEPFAKFRAHGLIVKDGAKMSKSKGNVVIPDEYIKKFGADTLRAYLMFAGPYSQGGDFRDSGIEGMFRFIKRVWTLFSEHSENSADQRIRQSDASDNQKLRSTESSEHMMHKTIKRVTEDIESLNYNTAIASLMEYYNFLSDQKSVSSEELEIFAKLLAPFAPHVSEELFSMINADKNQRMPADNNWQSIHLSAWPTYDPKFLVKDEFVIVIQVNGKLRGNIIVNSEKLKVKSYIENLARNEAKVTKYLEGKKVQKVIHVEGKVVNFVVS